MPLLHINLLIVFNIWSLLKIICRTPALDFLDSRKHTFSLNSFLNNQCSVVNQYSTPSGGLSIYLHLRLTVCILPGTSISRHPIKLCIFSLFIFSLLGNVLLHNYFYYFSFSTYLYIFNFLLLFNELLFVFCNKIKYINIFSFLFCNFPIYIFSNHPFDLSHFFP